MTNLSPWVGASLRACSAENALRDSGVECVLQSKRDQGSGPDCQPCSFPTNAWPELPATACRRRQAVATGYFRCKSQKTHVKELLAVHDVRSWFMHDIKTGTKTAVAGLVCPVFNKDNLLREQTPFHDVFWRVIWRT